MKRSKIKSLNEVIKANECCDHGELDSKCEDCPYNGIGACCAEREADALHYLEEYKNKQNVGTMMLALHNVNKTVCDDCWLSREMVGEGFKQIYKKYIEEQNPPLTWDELKQMEGKPVWVEERSCRLWIIARNFQRVQYRNIDTEWLRTDIREIYYDKADIGKTWQAYRKEKE